MSAGQWQFHKCIARLLMVHRHDDVVYLRLRVMISCIIAIYVHIVCMATKHVNDHNVPSQTVLYQPVIIS